MQDLNFFFNKIFYPKTLAFIGATSRRHWHLMGYINRFPKDSLYLVAKYDEELHGVKCYKEISELPDGIDHAIISINRKNLLNVVKQCVAKKFHTLHIFSAGTGEFDSQGLEIEDELYEIFKNSKTTKLVGPNCMGIYSPEGKYSYSGGFSETPGPFGLVSQSGDLTSRFVLMLNALRVYFSKAASVGNSIDLRASDFIDYYNKDEKTEVILCYLEGFSRYHKFGGRQFLDALKRNKKPLLLLKGGISSQGKRTVASHTGSLASKDEIWNAIFKQTNAIQIDSFDEMIDTTVLFRSCRNYHPKVNSVLMITWSGGSAVLGVDQIAKLNAGINVPPIQEPALSKMKKLIKVGSINNPLDLPGVRDRNLHYKICSIPFEEPYIGGIIQLTSGPRNPDDEEGVELYYDTLKKMRDYGKKLGKPYMITLPYITKSPSPHSGKNGEKKQPTFFERLMELDIPVFESFERAAKAFSNLYKFKNPKAPTNH